MATDISVNPAHAPGLTLVRFSRDGNKFYTAGADVVRVWDASKDASQEPKAITEADLDILALDCGDGIWAAGGAENNVQSYDAHSDQLKGYITRTPGVSIRCVAFSPDGTKIAVASE